MTAAETRAKAVKDRLPANPVVAEVGVFDGRMSRELLKMDGLQLVMVDSWGKHLDGKNELESMDTFLLKNAYASLYAQAVAGTAFASERRKLVREFSTSAAGTFPDRHFDCVFIDADHSYESVKADIKAWTKKVKLGGYICGHDFGTPDFPGVTKAVLELLGEVESGADTTWFLKVKEAVCAS